MARRMHLPAVALAAILAVAPGARAEVTVDQAKDLEGQLHDWLAGLVKSAIDVGERPVQVAPEGDHFRMLLPAPASLVAAGIIGPGLQLSMTARPMDGGRWALEDLRFPSPMRIRTPAGTASDRQAVVVEISAEAQEFHGVLDPSFATTSSFDAAITKLRSVAPQATTTTAKVTAHSVWQPAGDGRINVIGESGSDGIEVKGDVPNGGQMAYSIAKSRSSTTIANVGPASLATLVRSIAALVPTLQDHQDRLTPAQRDLARTAVRALADMMNGAEFRQSVEGLSFNAGGHAASLAKFAAGTRFSAPEGKLTWEADVALEGVDSPEIPKGLFRDYLPRKLAFKPSVTGIAAADLVKLALKAIDTDPKDMPALQADALALLEGGPLEVSLDDVVLDLGQASLAANGSVEITSPTDISADAEITLTGLDQLIKRANAEAELKQFVPVLIFLKGIGKADGDDTVWVLAYDDGKFTVNDTDMSALIPGNAPQGGGRPRTKPAKP